MRDKFDGLKELGKTCTLARQIGKAAGSPQLFNAILLYLQGEKFFLTRELNKTFIKDSLYITLSRYSQIVINIGQTLVTNPQSILRGLILFGVSFYGVLEKGELASRDIAWVILF